MKKATVMILAVLIIGSLLAGCDGATFSITTALGKSSIEVVNAENGAAADDVRVSVVSDYVEIIVEKTVK